MGISLTLWESGSPLTPTGGVGISLTLWESGSPLTPTGGWLTPDAHKGRHYISPDPSPFPSEEDGVSWGEVGGLAQV